MPFHFFENENNRSRSPHGKKESEGFVKLVDHPQRHPVNDLPPPIRGDAPISVAPHGSTDNPARHIGVFDRHISSGSAAWPARFVRDARSRGAVGDPMLKFGANRGPSGRK